MVNLTTYELRLIAGKRDIKNYKNMSRGKLLSTIDESERNFKNISQNGLERIPKMENLSQNELMQITKMRNLLQNELEQIARMRRIKNYKNMSKEKLLIALLKSGQSLAELYKSKSNNGEIEKTKKTFNEIRSKFSKLKMKEIRKKLYEKEKIDKYFKELENEEKKVKKYKEEQEKKHAKELNKINKSLEKLQENFKKYHYRDNDDPDYKEIRQIENLFDEINEDYCKPIKTKDAFNNNCIECESRGDKDKKLSVKEHLFMVMPYLIEMINNHKAPIIKDSNGIIIADDLSGEWKIQLTIQINFVSSLDSREIGTMDSKSDNVEIIMGNETCYY